MITYNEKEVEEMIKERLEARNNALEACQKQFIFYVGHHTVNGHHEKAETNKFYAEKCREALES